MSEPVDPDYIDNEELEERRAAFASEINPLIDEIAAKHFPGWYLHAHVLVYGLLEIAHQREIVTVRAPEGQSGFMTMGLLEHAKNRLL